MNLFQQDIVPPSVRKTHCTCKQTPREFCLVHGEDRIFYPPEEKIEEEN